MIIQQVSVWGDYGREKGRKVFMGVAVIYMDSITTSPGSSLTEWYRLFGSSSLVSVNERFRNSFPSLYPW